GSEAEFNQMNVLQRRALAQSIGVSVTELSKMVANQSNLNKQTKAQKESAAFMAHIMKAIRGLSEDLIKVWMVLKPIFMVALAPIGIAVFLLIKMVALIASGISALNEFGNAGTIILGIVMAILTAQKLQALWTGVVTTAQWALNAAMTANPVGAIVMGVILLVALVVGLAKKFGVLKYIIGAIGVAMAIAFWPITLAIGAVWLLYKGFMWVADAVGGIGNLMMGIGAALLVAMGPVGWLIGAGILIWKNFDKIWETIKGIGKAIIDFVMSPIRKLKAFMAGLLPGWALKLLGMGGGTTPEVAKSGTVAQDFISRPGSGMEKFDEGDTIVGVQNESTLAGGTSSVDIVPITDGLRGVIDSINALEASNKALTNSLIGKVKTLSEQ
ncbi:hypothetical protein CMI47_09705, partial [Candidatus Pacearchaeota archaeon]|nr:hypothetical protein [Candidatus Pacearchaeota archaeon]